MGLFTKTLAAGISVGGSALVRGGVNDVAGGSAVTGAIKIGIGSVMVGVVVGTTVAVNYMAGAASGVADGVVDHAGGRVKEFVDDITTQV